MDKEGRDVEGPKIAPARGLTLAVAEQEQTAAVSVLAPSVKLEVWCFVNLSAERAPVPRRTIAWKPATPVRGLRARFENAEIEGLGSQTRKLEQKDRLSRTLFSLAEQKAVFAHLAVARSTLLRPRECAELECDWDKIGLGRGSGSGTVAGKPRETLFPRLGRLFGVFSPRANLRSR
eukprot:1380843-Rhodomonas_salina.2